MLMVTPTTETVPPGAAQPTASAMVRSAPDGLDDRVGAAPGGEGQHPGGAAAGPVGPGVHGLGPHGLGPGQAVGHGVDGQQAGRAEEAGALEGQQPHRPQPDHRHRGTPGRWPPAGRPGSRSAGCR